MYHIFEVHYSGVLKKTSLPIRCCLIKNMYRCRTAHTNIDHEQTFISNVAVKWLRQIKAQHLAFSPSRSDADLCFAGDPEAFHQHPQPEKMGLLHRRDSVHGALLRLEDDGCEVARRRGGGRRRQQQEEDRVAVLQQR